MDVLDALRDLSLIFLALLTLVWAVVQIAAYGALYWVLRRFGGRGIALVHRGGALTERAAGTVERVTERTLVRPAARLRGRAEWLRTFYRELR